MQKFIILFFSILLTGCCSEPNYLKNGLTKEVSKVTEYTLKIEEDSLNNPITDTLVVTEKEYNNNNLIIRRVQKSLYDNETIKIDYNYDKNHQIIKEIVNLSNENSNFIVNYFYQDSLIERTISEGKNDNFEFKQIGKYQYDDKNILEQTTMEYIFIDPKSQDTVSHKIEMSEFNDEKIETESKFIDLLNPERNQLTKYDYKCGLLSEEKRFNNDSLISKIKYKYKFDDFDNWIRRESYEKGKLSFIKIREIEYN